MAQICQVKGVQRALGALHGSTTASLGQITVGLERAGLYLQRESQRVVPVLTGNLRASAFTRAINPNTPAVQVQVGYTANYALYVHENLDAFHKPGKQAKFLEGPARSLSPQLTAILKAAVK